MWSEPGQAGTETPTDALRRPPGGARPKRKANKLFVILGVTVYCVAAWGIMFAGIGAGWHALFPNSSSFASGPAAANEPDAE